MDKKKKQKHITQNKPKQQSTMEKKKKKQQQNENHKSKSIHDILPLELIHRILLRVPLKQLGRLKCVSKIWNTLISDLDFAKSHVHLSAAPTHVCLFIDDYSEACSVDIDAVFDRHKSATALKEVSLPFKMKTHYDFEVMCSCRGLVLLHRAPHFFVVWNPVTGSSKRVSYSHIVSCYNRKWFMFPRSAILYGFGYDASQDDYLVVVASQDKNGQEHFDCLSLKTNSWINLDFALSKPLGWSNWESSGSGFFLNGAIHWSSCTLRVRDYSILIFDLKERSFSTISMPEQVMGYLNPTHLGLLGGCLALYSCECDKTNIWVMKEYKVHSSWTFYQISRGQYAPLCLSNGSDIVALDSSLIFIDSYLRFAKSNVRGELLQLKCFDCRHVRHFKGWSSRWCKDCKNYIVYTESLVPVPNEIKDKDKDKKKKNGHPNKKNDVKQGKRTRSE
ncbi:F-box/kelch-repeat protein At3g23880-like [Arachis stenosperma]|uniref:F-box/kelch-repeat protein At3g23880-like n=1 Tax=Arachis stenosperma TaxID=217475 RepID=UPI0025AC876D|nr:F-box/kelch-repeat protein At3g23880-like [Arachis stenosperma]XP_057753643.1 F-box/kelch-repeat protein At3g23880-like [Arachis stenosperma]XP_057753644.1 F-box/kelch-repeat protein At3g23880-like [Arachis stenosperma]